MISIRHLCKQFPNSTPLKDVNVEINKGDIISVIGPSGAGKSTLLRCMNFLEKPTAGEIWIDGERITERNAPALRRKMGMVFQSFNLFSHMTVIENIMFGPVTLLGKSRQEAYEHGIELLRSVGLADRALRFPDELSGGQKQRVAIARTLAMDPEIILLDEPTSALDPTMVGEVLAVIRTLAQKGLTMMIVTHEMSFARDVSNRAFYLDEGVIYEEGTPEEIFEHPQRDKTRKFVKHLQLFSEQITSKDFDFIAVNTRMEEFGRAQEMEKKTIRAATVIFEELCVQTILPYLADDFKMEIALEYAAGDRQATMHVRFDGEPFDPIFGNNSLSMSLIRNMAKEIRYDEIAEDGFVNEVTVKLK